MKTVVLIPNYNGAKFLDPCMSALDRQTYRDFRVLIVDNGSSDGSAELLHRYEKEGRAEVLYLSENTGFSGAVNAGIDHCLSEQDTPEWIVLLNNDTEAAPGYLQKMAEVMEADTEERIAAVSPLMLSLQDPARIDSAGDGYTVVGWAYQRGTGRNRDLPKFRKQTAVFSACAGAAMYRAKALMDIRFPDGEIFDRRHFAYLEDVDVSFRLQLRGYRILYVPEAEVLHVGSGTSGSKYNAFKVRLAARNNVYLIYKNMPFLLLLLNLLPILAGAAVKYLFFVKKGFGKAYREGFSEGLSTVSALKDHKQRVPLSGCFRAVKAELLLILGTFSYLEDLLMRKVFHS